MPKNKTVRFGDLDLGNNFSTINTDGTKTKRRFIKIKELQDGELRRNAVCLNGIGKGATYYFDDEKKIALLRH